MSRLEIRLEKLEAARGDVAAELRSMSDAELRQLITVELRYLGVEEQDAFAVFDQLGFERGWAHLEEMAETVR